MLNNVLLISLISLYLVSTALIASFIHKTNKSPQPSSENVLKIAFYSGCLATVLHLVFAYYYCIVNGELNFSLSSMVVMISGILSAVYVLGALNLPIRRLGLLVFPLTVMSLIFSQLWDNEFVGLDNSSPIASAHIVISIIAYCLLTLATVQAILYVYQERQLKQRKSPTMLLALPPLETMEALLFRLVWAGFILLTFTLLSGSFFTHEIYDRPFKFKHHTILAIIGWGIYGTLLIKRHFHGIRGLQAVFWTTTGFLLIQLGYFGTKIVSEILGVQ